jgi:GTP-binding protein HflX
VGRLYMPNRHIDVLVTDTIGFIQNLPTSLIDAFKSTLMESVNADLLLHVIDIADPLIHEKIIVVEDILQELGIAEKRKIYVFNKIDQTNDMTEKREDLREAYGEFNPQFVSAHTEEGMHRLVLAIEQLFNKP